MMIPSMFEKVVFVIPAVILYYQHRVSPVIFGVSLVDLVLGVFLSYFLHQNRNSERWHMIFNGVMRGLQSEASRQVFTA
jgi:MFS superfamily sulfate permease-like transporter